MEEIHLGLESLKKSSLYRYRKDNDYIPVIGEGNISASIMFIGEAPGKTEAETGKPFCGRSGIMLDELLASIKLDRADVYVTNLVKDRPQDNRDPSPEEIALYGPFLDSQIEIIQPRIIATLGRLSMKYIFKKYGIESSLKPISEIHGKKFKIKTLYGDIFIIPLYHPAAALYNGSLKRVLLDDVKILK